MKTTAQLLEEYKELFILPTRNVYQKSRMLEIEQRYYEIMGSPINFTIL